MELFNNTQVAYARMSKFELRRAYILFKSLQISIVFKMVKQLVWFCFKLRLPVGWIVKPTVFKQFIGGVSLQECIPIASRLEKYNVKAILDYSSEDGSSDNAIEQTLQETLLSIEVASKHPNISFAVFKPTAFCSLEALEAVSSGTVLSVALQQKIAKFKDCVDILCKKAYDFGVPIMIDAEDYSFQSFVDEVVTDKMAVYNKQRAIVYNTLQMYRHDRLEFLKESFRKAEERDYFLGIKLVRGAYMERERIRSVRLGYPSPIWPDKVATDIAFDKALDFCVQHLERINLFSGTHNEHSNYFLMESMDKLSLEKKDPRVWFSQLYGMSDNITYNLALLGYNVSKYIPYGPVRKVLPYLIRRAEENSSVAGQTSRELDLIRTELKRRK